MNNKTQTETEYKVNGTQFGSDEKTLTAREILERARERGVIPGPPDGYILKGAKRDYRGDEIVNLVEDNLFITVPNTPTQVA